MNAFNIADLKPGIFLTADAVLDKNFILLSDITPLTEPLIKALTDWDFKQIFSNGELTSVPNEADKEAEKEAEIKKQNEKVETRKVGSVITDDIQSIIDAVSTEKENTSEMQAKRLEVVEKVYNQYLDYVERVYTRFATHKELDLKALSKNIQDMCIFVKDNTRYILRTIQSAGLKDKNFIITHSLRSTIIAISIGLQLSLPLSKLIELGVACVLHEMGMLKLPPQLYMTDKPLTISEKKALLTHPILAYDILKSYNFPLSICLGVLEHHEKENTSGYPQKLDGGRISMYAKIIAVACTFESMTAHRQYKEPQNNNAAMIELLKNTGNQYDESVIKALLYSVSLFPLGTYVYLSDGKIGMSVDVNPLDPKNPVIELINETDENGEPKLVQPGGRDLSITRALTESEMTDLLKSMPSKKARVAS
ncbi:HD domain-containing protein [Treponema sp. OMZ 840]|uniref:HD-GYP domain-containing protein n=1 Tax=Treponema sp. OMZ 840 TaxID=244313 RepID=UPI003D8F8656